MFPHTVWTEGAQRAARYRDEAESHRVVAAAGIDSPTRRTLAHMLHRTADALARIAERLAPSHTIPTPRSVRRPPAASA